MFLKRVQVEKFRALENVDITFEKYNPPIFPLGSLNGGGKSTLLQLIFVLLHCSFDEKKYEFIKNMLEDVKLNEERELYSLAKFEIEYENKEYKIEFFLIIGIYISLTGGLDINHIHFSENKLNLISRGSIPKKILKDLSKKVFLNAPNTQIFLFLSKDEKKSIFSVNVEHHYYTHIAKSQKILENFFTYDFVAPELIVEAFKKARDKDFEMALENQEYGDNFIKLKKDLDNFLFNKTITIDKDLSRIIFKFKDSNEELMPEDLSHGELKKLAIYVWLKSKDISDSLILMDEIENGLHPDWQYEIINDLKEWGKGNQFILATHSYELCNALTPAHVKELEPKLTKE